MAITKIITKVDGAQSQQIDFQEIVSGLGGGAHTLSVEIYDGNTLIDSQTVNITIDAGSGYDSDYQAILDYGTAQGYTLPTSAEQDAGNQYMLDLKTSGLYARAKVLFVPDQGGDDNFKLICWKRKTVMTNVAGTFDASGYTGGAGGAIKTGYIPATDNATLEDNAGLGIVQLTEFGAGQQMLGVREAANASNMISSSPDATGKITARFNDSTTAQSATVNAGHISRLISINKKTATDYEFISGSSADANRVSETITGTDGGNSSPNAELYLMAWHREDDGAGTISNSATNKVKFIYYGEPIHDIHDAVNAVVKVGA